MRIRRFRQRAGLGAERPELLSSPAGPPVREAAVLGCRALLEAWAMRMWAPYSGVLVWKTQNPWAGLRGQLYDWLLAPTGGLYGARTALRPLHALLDPTTMQASCLQTDLLSLLHVSCMVGDACVCTLDPGCRSVQACMQRPELRAAVSAAQPAAQPAFVAGRLQGAKRRCSCVAGRREVCCSIGLQHMLLCMAPAALRSSLELQVHCINTTLLDREVSGTAWVFMVTAGAPACHAPRAHWLHLHGLRPV